MNMQYELNFKGELIIDNFAGGGGASIGIENGLNRFIDVAINHDPIALYVHKLNHPHTIHLPSDVFEVDPVEVCQGRPVGLAWFSPDCKHFSKAKGGMPVEKRIRGLAWVARKWAKRVRPRIIILENVTEFLSWGPVITVDGQTVPDKKRASLTFKAFDGWFRRNGYKTDFKKLRACDYGAPTIRERLFWVARCDDQPISWPLPTHGQSDSPLVKKKQLKPYRTTAECIDWSLPCPSIFMSKNEAADYSKGQGIYQIKRPLVDATLRRIAKGVVKYVIKDTNPFFVNSNAYMISRQFGQSIGHSVHDPIGTITANGGGKNQLVKIALAPMIAKQFGKGICHSIDEPLCSIMAGGEGEKSQIGSQALENKDDCDRDYIDSGATRVAAFILKYYGTNIGHGLREPIHTITTKDRFALVTVIIKGEPWVIVDIGVRMLQPHELMIAQGFPANYNFGDISNSNKVRLIGNSVPPEFSKAMVIANMINDTVWKAA